MPLRIVTDSACDVPRELAEALHITVVPVYINIGERSYLDGVELPRQEFYDNLATYSSYPTTAAPSSGAFKAAYEKLAADGATEILSMHIASNLSATYNAARLGAEAIDSVPVTVFDTKQITLGAGLLVVLAAEAAEAGFTAAEVRAALEERVPRTRVFGMIDNLTALRRSGRVSWAEFGLGTLLQIKPVMMIREGEVSVVARIRTRQNAVTQLMRMVGEIGPFERLAVIHVNAPEAADALRRQADPLFPPDSTKITTEITPAIGTHLGPGAVGFASIAVDG
jgi:DegV family protein with EDD domain